jgi:hypothetical protein
MAREQVYMSLSKAKTPNEARGIISTWLRGLAVAIEEGKVSGFDVNLDSGRVKGTIDVNLPDGYLNIEHMGSNSLHS